MAVAYINRDNPDAAARFRQRSEQVLRRLEQFPESGRIAPEFPDLPYREVVVRPYRFFYRVKETVVWVVAVWHGLNCPESRSDEIDLVAEDQTRASSSIGAAPIQCPMSTTMPSGPLNFSS